jgi:hypothetical protein
MALPAVIISPMVWAAGLLARPLDWIARTTGLPEVGRAWIDALEAGRISAQIAAAVALVSLVIVAPFLLVLAAVVGYRGSK